MYYHSEPEWTWAQWHWRNAPHSQKFQHHRKLTIRLFCVIARTLIRGGVLSFCRADWAIFKKWFIHYLSLILRYSTFFGLFPIFSAWLGKDHTINLNNEIELVKKYFMKTVQLVKKYFPLHNILLAYLRFKKCLTFPKCAKFNCCQVLYCL